MNKSTRIASFKITHIKAAVLFLACFLAMLPVDSVQATGSTPDDSLARRELNKLGPLDAFIKIRKKITESRNPSEFAPYVSSDLSGLLLELGKLDDPKGKVLAGSKDLTLAFPGKAEILSCNVQNQLATIKLVPAGENGDVDPKKMEFDIAEVIMEYKNGIWKMKNVNKLPLDAWCLKAATEMPPSVPCQASIGGKKYQVTSATQSGDSFTFELSTPSHSSNLQVTISDRKFSELLDLFRSGKMEQTSQNRVVYKRPLRKREPYTYEVWPTVGIIDLDTEKPIFSCKSGHGLHILINNHAKTRVRNGVVHTAHGAIFMRLPDQCKSYLEGYFDLTWR
ncbi:hypothetical protein GC174_07300 [bacterium]|nr:hypothetical protein [bacterium]